MSERVGAGSPESAAVVPGAAQQSSAVQQVIHEQAVYRQAGRLRVSE